MINSCKKGKAAEREVANMLSEIFPGAMRGFQFRGGHETADVTDTGWFWVEVKRGKRPNIHDAMEQAIEDCGVNLHRQALGRTGFIPTVFSKKDYGQWIVTMLADDWIRIMKTAKVEARP